MDHLEQLSLRFAGKTLFFTINNSWMLEKLMIVSGNSQLVVYSNVNLCESLKQRSVHVNAYTRIQKIRLSSHQTYHTQSYWFSLIQVENTGQMPLLKTEPSRNVIFIDIERKWQNMVLCLFCLLELKMLKFDMNQSIHFPFRQHL